MRARTLFVVLLAVVTTAACDEATGTLDGLTETEVQELADGMIATSFGATGEVAQADLASTDGLVLQLAGDTVTSTTEFVTTRTCVRGGQVVLEGTRERVWDRDTRTGSSDLALTKTHEDCARPLRDRDVTITVNGAPNIAVEVHHAWADGERDGLQTMSMNGTIDWATDDDRSGTCTIDVDVTFDPDARTRTVSGTVCNRTFERTTTWQGGGGG